MAQTYYKCFSGLMKGKRRVMMGGSMGAIRVDVQGKALCCYYLLGGKRISARFSHVRHVLSTYLLVARRTRERGAEGDEVADVDVDGF